MKRFVSIVVLTVIVLTGIVSFASCTTKDDILGWYVDDYDAPYTRIVHYYKENGKIRKEEGEINKVRYYKGNIYKKGNEFVYKEEYGALVVYEETVTITYEDGVKALLIEGKVAYKYIAPVDATYEEVVELIKTNNPWKK